MPRTLITVVETPDYLGDARRVLNEEERAAAVAKLVKILAKTYGVR